MSLDFSEVLRRNIENIVSNIVESVVTTVVKELFTIRPLTPRSTVKKPSCCKATLKCSRVAKGIKSKPTIRSRYLTCIKPNRKFAKIIRFKNGSRYLTASWMELAGGLNSDCTPKEPFENLDIGPWGRLRIYDCLHHPYQTFGGAYGTNTLPLTAPIFDGGGDDLSWSLMMSYPVPC